MNKIKLQPAKPPSLALKGTVLLLITHEQIRMHNRVLLSGGGDLVIDASVNPNEWSVEEAVVVSVNRRNPVLTPGTKVVIDFGILTAGMEEKIQLTDATRIAGRDARGVYYYASDGSLPPSPDGQNSSSTEILGVYVPNGTVGTDLVPYPGLVYIGMPDDSPHLKLMNGIFVPQFEDRERLPFVAKVTHSGVPGVPIGCEILIEPMMSIEIRTSLGKFEYVPAEYIMGIIDATEESGIRLF